MIKINFGKIRVKLSWHNALIIAGLALLFTFVVIWLIKEGRILEQFPSEVQEVSVYLEYADRPADYSPQVNETFSVNLLIEPDNYIVQGIDLDVVFSDIDLWFIGGSVERANTEVVPYPFVIEQVSSQTRKIPLTVLSDWDDPGISQKSKILRLTFGRRTGNATQISLENLIVAAEGLDQSRAGVINLMIPETTAASPSPTLGPLPTLGPSPSPTLNPVSWKTDYVFLEADDFYIIADGQKYSADVNTVMVDSDPGDATYTTLEMIWDENNREMRLFMYFFADGEYWWSPELRTYNGQEWENWIYYKEKEYFKTSLGTVFTGDIDLNSTSSDPNNQYTGSIHFENLRLQAFLDQQPVSETLSFKVAFTGIDSEPTDKTNQVVQVSVFESGNSANYAHLVSTTTFDNNGHYHGSLVLPTSLHGLKIDVKIKGPKHLARRFNEIASWSSELDLTYRGLLPGDLPESGAGQDGVVNLHDMDVLVAAMADNNTQVADLNLDGVVNAFDLNLIRNTLLTRPDE